jgi:hypothetical protein
LGLGVGLGVGVGVGVGGGVGVGCGVGVVGGGWGGGVGELAEHVERSDRRQGHRRGRLGLPGRRHEGVGDGRWARGYDADPDVVDAGDAQLDPPLRPPEHL